MTFASSPNPLPARWRLMRLADVGQIVSGVTLGRRLRERPTRSVPYLRVANVKDGFLVLDDVRQIEVTEGEFERWLLREGDLLLTEGGDPDKLGRGTVWKGQVPECIYQNHIFRVRLDTETVLPEFVSAEIASPYGKAYFLRHAKQTTGIATINQKVLGNFPMKVPSIKEQRDILAILDEQMTMVDRARAAAAARLNAANALSRAQLRATFAERTGMWGLRPLGGVCRLLPSRSVATIGDAPVEVITTACLTEEGFDPAGVKRARMWAADAVESTVSPGEILVARSNTPELVGRTAVFSGEPAGVVASDLTIRIAAGPELMPGFVGGYLSYLYATGYWRERAGGASGSMKKITRSQIEAQLVPVPSLSEQETVLTSLSSALSTARLLRRATGEEVAAMGSLPGTLLARAFQGEL